MLKYLMFAMVLAYGTVCHGAALMLHETISVGSTTPALGTTTIDGAAYTAALSYEGLYTYNGSGTCYFRYDGGTVTVGNGHGLTHLNGIVIDKITQSRNIQFITDGPTGTVIATHTRVTP